MPKISVIIPVYNAEKYLHQCIDSVINQNFTDFEVLLINDGSTDHSGKICDEYAKKDKRIKVFHQENKGVSAARNLGLDNAKGEWISFVDSDDWVGDKFFSTFITEQLNIEADFILDNIIRIVNNDSYNVTNFNTKLYTVEEFLKFHTIHPHFFGPHAKFYKRRIIEKFEIRFDIILSYGEDTIFNCEFLLYAKLIYLDNNEIYFQRVVENSLSTAKPNLKKDGYKYERLLEILNRLNLPSDILEKNIYPTVSRYFISIIQSDKNIWKKYLLSTKLLNKYKNVFINDLKNSKRGIYLSYVLKFKLYFIFVFILNLKNDKI